MISTDRVFKREVLVNIYACDKILLDVKYTKFEEKEWTIKYLTRYGK